MPIQEPVQFKGVPGSPYTGKMLAYHALDSAAQRDVNAVLAATGCEPLITNGQ